MSLDQQISKKHKASCRKSPTSPSQFIPTSLSTIFETQVSITKVAGPTTRNKGGSPKVIALPQVATLLLPWLLLLLLRCDNVESRCDAESGRRRSSQSDKAKLSDKGFLVKGQLLFREKTNGFWCWKKLEKKWMEWWNTMELWWNSWIWDAFGNLVQRFCLDEVLILLDLPQNPPPILLKRKSSVSASPRCKSGASCTPRSTTIPVILLPVLVGHKAWNKWWIIRILCINNWFCSTQLLHDLNIISIGPRHVIPKRLAILQGTKFHFGVPLHLQRFFVKVISWFISSFLPSSVFHWCLVVINTFENPHLPYSFVCFPNSAPGLQVMFTIKAKVWRA